MVMERASRHKHGNEAYELQRDAGIYGMIKYTAVATVACFIAHKQFPLFRRQTLALKGFLVSSATMAGLVIEAEDVLQKYEQDQRIAYNLHRRWAKIGLAREGRVPTESELESWIQENKHRFPRIEKGADGVVRKITPGAPPEPASADPSKALSPDTTPRTQESTVEILSNGGSPALASSVWKK